MGTFMPRPALRHSLFAIALLPVACTTGAITNGPEVFASSATATATESGTATADTSVSDSDNETGSASADASSDPTTEPTESATDPSTGTPGDVSSGTQSDSSVAMCGDDELQGDEDCDGTDLGDATCQTLGFDDGVLACDPECHLITDACFTCGDGDVALTEACDGNELGGETCVSLGFGGGSLSCAADCSQIVTSGCTALPSCGDGVRNGGEQCDGNDFGGNTCVTQGFDMGTLDCTASCLLDVSQCEDDLSGCGMMGDFCIFDENDLQSTCCPAGVGGNKIGICNVFVCI
jgi:hypothetical protein